MKPSISVLVTCWNEKETLWECIDSVLKQTVRPDEIIVYDNASSAPADRCVSEGSPVKIIRGALFADKLKQLLGA